MNIPFYVNELQMIGVMSDVSRVSLLPTFRMILSSNPSMAFHVARVSHHTIHTQNCIKIAFLAKQPSIQHIVVAFGCVPNHQTIPTP